MKKKYLFILILFCTKGFGQEKIIDSVLVKNIGRTYREYLAHFEKVDTEYQAEISKIREAIQKNNYNEKSTLPTFPNKIETSEEFPLVILTKGKKEYNLIDLDKFILDKKKLKRVKNVYHYPSQSAESFLYGTRGQFGVYIIEVE